MEDKKGGCQMGSVEKFLVSEEALTIYVARGILSRDEIKQAISDFYLQGPVTRNVLWDFSAAELSAITSEDVCLIANIPKKSAHLRTGGKTAIYAPNDLTYGLSRMYARMASFDGMPFELEVFRDQAAARSWISGKTCTN